MSIITRDDRVDNIQDEVDYLESLIGGDIIVLTQWIDDLEAEQII